MNRVVKSFTAQTKVLDAAAGLVDCVASVTGNLDRQGDRIVAGAFAPALSRPKAIPVVYGHKWDSLDAVLGKTLNVRELMPNDPSLPTALRSAGYGGLRSTIKFDLDTPAGQLAFTHLAHGNLSEYSFGFDISEGGAEYRDEKAANGSRKSVRYITSISEIFEISVVLIGANQLTETVSAKAGSRSSVPDWMFVGAYNAAAARLSNRRDIR